MHLAWLKDFIAIAETGHFGQSADKRLITNSALSRRIKSLEEWAGVELLDRSAHPIKLTPAGEQFIPVAEQVVYLLERGRMKMENSLVILATGGTLEKVHNELEEMLSFPSDGENQVEKVLKIGRCYFPEVRQICQKDSLDFTDADREDILKAINEQSETRIVITHGTSTMDETAKYLDGKTRGKTIVLTGAMRPFSLGKSDADFNLGGAVIAAQALPAGIYGVMNGCIFNAQDLEKNQKAGRFDV